MAIQPNPALAATPALARTGFEKGPAPVTKVSAPRRNASATIRSKERTLLPPNATGRRSSRLNHNCGPPSAAERRLAGASGVGSVTSDRRGSASSSAVHEVTAGALLGPGPPALDTARFGPQWKIAGRFPSPSGEHGCPDPPQR